MLSFINYLDCVITRPRLAVHEAALFELKDGFFYSTNQSHWQVRSRWFGRLFEISPKISILQHTGNCFSDLKIISKKRRLGLSNSLFVLSSKKHFLPLILGKQLLLSCGNSNCFLKDLQWLCSSLQRFENRKLSNANLSVEHKEGFVFVYV
jgi:hypothetical protein